MCCCKAVFEKQRQNLHCFPGEVPLVVSGNHQSHAVVGVWDAQWKKSLSILESSVVGNVILKQLKAAVVDDDMCIV